MTDPFTSLKHVKTAGNQKELEHRSKQLTKLNKKLFDFKTGDIEIKVRYSVNNVVSEDPFSLTYGPDEKFESLRVPADILIKQNILKTEIENGTKSFNFTHYDGYVVESLLKYLCYRERVAFDHEKVADLFELLHLTKFYQLKEYTEYIIDVICFGYKFGNSWDELNYLIEAIDRATDDIYVHTMLKDSLIEIFLQMLRLKGNVSIEKFHNYFKFLEKEVQTSISHAIMKDPSIEVTPELAKLFCPDATEEELNQNKQLFEENQNKIKQDEEAYQNNNKRKREEEEKEVNEPPSKCRRLCKLFT